MSSLPGTTFTFCSRLPEPDVDSAFGAAALAVGAAAGLAGACATGVGCGTAAGFTAAAGAPAAGFDVAGTPAAFNAALESFACFCCSDFATLRALSIASGFCPQPALVISAIAKVPIVSFIAVFMGYPYLAAAVVAGFAPAPAAGGCRSRLK